MEKSPPGSAANNKRHKEDYLKDVTQFIFLFIKVKLESSYTKHTKENEQIVTRILLLTLI